MFCSDFDIVFLWGKGCYSHCCSNIEKRRTGWPYLCHSNMREFFRQCYKDEVNVNRVL